MREEGTCKEGLRTERSWPLVVEEVSRYPTGREFWNLRGHCVSLSCDMTGKAGMMPEVVLLGLERLGVISGKAQQELPACGGSRVRVMSCSQRAS